MKNVRAQIYRRFEITYDSVDEFTNDVQSWVGLGYTFSFWQGPQMIKPGEGFVIAYQKEVAATLADK